MSYTTDPKDPRLCKGTDQGKVPQCEVYLILSEEERAKGFVRPLRTKYRHVGPIKPKYPLIDTPDQSLVEEYGWVKYEKYPEGSDSIGKYWTQKDLDDKGCCGVTTMSLPLSETYARDPKFYGATYCAFCQRHIDVDHFVWDGTNERVGS